MKNQNIPGDIKSKSLKEARDEINEILNKLEGKDADLENYVGSKDWFYLINILTNYLKQRSKNIHQKKRKK